MKEAMSTNRVFLCESRRWDVSNQNCPSAAQLWVLQASQLLLVEVTNVLWLDMHPHLINFVAARIVHELIIVST